MHFNAFRANFLYEFDILGQNISALRIYMKNRKSEGLEIEIGSDLKVQISKIHMKHLLQVPGSIYIYSKSYISKIKIIKLRGWWESFFL